MDTTDCVLICSGFGRGKRFLQMPWTTINFGRHEGRTLPQVLFADPDWFFWAWEKGVFEHHPELLPEAEVLFAKATSIKIPQTGEEPMLVEYQFYYENHTSVGFEIVPASRPPHEGSTPTRRAGHIDMRIPRQQKGYDKLGYRHFIDSLKFAYFGDANRRMTRQRCEEFFDNAANFNRNG